LSEEPSPGEVRDDSVIPYIPQIATSKWSSFGASTKPQYITNLGSIESSAEVLILWLSCVVQRITRSFLAVTCRSRRSLKDIDDEPRSFVIHLPVTGNSRPNEFATTSCLPVNVPDHRGRPMPTSTAQSNCIE
jgi:hypothetical protein